VTKRCPKCGETKVVSKFSKDKARKGGYCCYCKACEKAYKSSPKGMQVRRNALRKYYFGITAEEFVEMLVRQKGVCAICGEPETNIDYRSGEVRALCVDHDHQTGKIRELLCYRCNLVVGHSREDAKILKDTINYLKKHN